MSRKATDKEIQDMLESQWEILREQIVCGMWKGDPEMIYLLCEKYWMFMFMGGRTTMKEKIITGEFWMVVGDSIFDAAGRSLAAKFDRRS